MPGSQHPCEFHSEARTSGDQPLHRSPLRDLPTQLHVESEEIWPRHNSRLLSDNCLRQTQHSCQNTTHAQVCTNCHLPLSSTCAAVDRHGLVRYHSGRQMCEVLEAIVWQPASFAGIFMGSAGYVDNLGKESQMAPAPDKNSSRGFWQSSVWVPWKVDLVAELGGAARSAGNDPSSPPWLH